MRLNLRRCLREYVIQLGSARRTQHLHYAGRTDVHTPVVSGLEKGEAMEKSIFISAARPTDDIFSAVEQPIVYLHNKGIVLNRF